MRIGCITCPREHDRAVCSRRDIDIVIYKRNTRADSTYLSLSSIFAPPSSFDEANERDMNAVRLIREFQRLRLLRVVNNEIVMDAPNDSLFLHRLLAENSCTIELSRVMKWPTLLPTLLVAPTFVYTSPTLTIRLTGENSSEYDPGLRFETKPSGSGQDFARIARSVARDIVVPTKSRTYNLSWRNQVPTKSEPLIGGVCAFTRPVDVSKRIAENPYYCPSSSGVAPMEIKTDLPQPFNDNDEPTQEDLSETRALFPLQRNVGFGSEDI